MQIFAHFVGNFLVNSAWQIVLIAAMAGLCSHLGTKTSAVYRHSIWVAALVLSVVIPALSALRPVLPPAPMAAMPTRSKSFGRGAPNQGIQAALPSPHASVSQSHSPLWLLAPRPQPRIPIRTGFAIVAAALYAAFISFRLIQFSMALRDVWRLAASSETTDHSQSVQTISARCRAAFGLPPIPILGSPKVQAPATLGARRPVIIVPIALLDSSEPMLLEAVIGHEMAHIKRRDFSCNLIYELLYLPISFHPAAALVKRRIAQTRELACDELVTEQLLGAVDYARALVTVASRVTGPGRPGYTLGVFTADNLEERIMKLTETKSRHGERAERVIMALSAFLLLLTGAAASAYCLRTGPAVSDVGVGAKQQEKSGAPATERMALDRPTYSSDAPIPAKIKPLLGSWKGSNEHDITAPPEQLLGRDPFKQPWNTHLHSDVQIDFLFEDGELLGHYKIYQRMTRSDGTQTFRIHQSEFVNPRFDGVTVSTVTTEQRNQNQEDQEATGQPGTRYTKVKVTGDGVAETWVGAGDAEAQPHLILTKEKPGYQPNHGSTK